MDIVFKPIERVKWLVLVIVSVLHISGAHGQDAIISFQLTPPYDQPLIEYKDKLNTSIAVPGQNELSAFLAVSIFNDNRSIEIMSTPAGRKPVELVQGGNMFNGSDFDDLIDLNRLTFRGIEPSTVFFDQGLPPGRYFFCLELYNELGEQISNTACTNIAVDIPPVATNLIFLPPYNVPFDNFQDQTTLTFTTRTALSAMLEMTLTDADNAITIVKSNLVNLEEGTNLFTGTDLAFYFSPGGFTTLNGVDEAQLFDTGLPPSTYFLTFNLTAEGIPVASTSRQFFVAASTITMNASITPAYDVPLDELLSQTTLTITSSGNVADAFVALEINGERTRIISDVSAVSNRINLTANVPEVLTASDLINVAGGGVQFQGVTPQEALNTGLRGGNYSVCYRLFDNAGQPLTEVASCFSLNVPPALINLTVQAVPPFIRQVEDLYSMLRVNVTSTRDLEMGFSVRIRGDNGVTISGRAAGPIPETFALEKNLPQLLMNGDLLSYFDPNQLVILGANRNNLFTNGLPVGNYQICLTPIVTNGPPAENLVEVCSNPVPVNLIEAPQLILPTCGETFDIERGQIIPFNWLPAPGAPQDTEYTLKIVEMLNPRQNPYDALLTSAEPAFFEETVMRTNFLYGPAQPLLEPGRKYAYQVFIADEYERGNYTNDGLSEACWFQVADILPSEEEQEEDSVRSPLVVVQPIEENPFPGYSFPITTVSGTLKYKFKERRPLEEEDNTINATTYQAGISANLPSILEPNTSPTFSEGDQISTTMTIVREGITYTPPFNESDLSTDDSFTIPAGVNIRLIEGYLVYGTLYGEAVMGAFVGDPWGRVPKTVAATTTGPNGAFEFTFIQYDSLGLPITLSDINGTIASGTFFKVYRMVVDNPYYYSPEMNIMVQPWEHIDVGSIVSYVHEYQLKVIVKTGVKSGGDLFADSDQVVDIGATLTNVNAEVKRTVGPSTWPYAEGQNLPGFKVSEGVTAANGAVIFNRLVRHNLKNPLDQYQITVATNQYKGVYNYVTVTESYPKIDPPEGAMRGANPLLFNSEWRTQHYEHTITMYPEVPRVFGEVRAQQPPAQLAERRQSPNSNDITASSINGNTSYQNFLSSSLGQLSMSLSELSEIYADIPNWSEMVNEASLPDVTVTLMETYNHWQENNTDPIVTLKQQSNENGQFSFDGLQPEIDFNSADIGGPTRLLIIDHPGYTPFYKNVPVQGYLKWGQQYKADVLLEPDGFVFGYVEDDQGNPVKAEVFIGEFTSAMTVQDQEMQNALGIPGGLKEIFLIKAPSGGTVKLNVVPDNLVYAPSDYEVSIDGNNTKIPQNLGAFEVNLYKHRITLQVTEEELMAGNDRQGKYPTGYYPPIKNALVKVTNLLNKGPATNTRSSQPSTGDIGVQQPGQSNLINTTTGDPIYGYTDEEGLVTLSFSNNAQEFHIEVIPPADMDFAKEYLTVTSEPSGQPVFAGRVELTNAWRISGRVTYGNDSTPLPNARVFIDDDLEVFTNSYGDYLLKHIPQSFTEYTITAENRNNPLTLIAETKIVQMPSGDLNFNLVEFSDFEIKELMGIPITVKSIVPNGADYLLDGAFINLPGNSNFSVKDTETQLDFHQVPITSVTKNGKQVAKAVNSTITLDAHELDLINYTKFLAKQLPTTGTQLKMTIDSMGVGELNGKVLLLNSSFDFNEQYMSFNEETSSVGRNSQEGQYTLTTSSSPTSVTDNLRRSYIDLFNDLSQFRLFDDQQNSNMVKTLTAGNYPLRSFGVSDQNNNDYEFKVQAFNAVAEKEESYVYQDSLVLSTRLNIDNIPLSIPKDLEIDVGDIIVTSEGFSEILGGDPLTFKLEEWEVTCPDWTLDPNSTGIKVPKGKIDFGLFTTEILNIKLLPNDLQIGGVNPNKVKLGDLVPVTLKPEVTTSFGIDDAAGADNQPHWKLSFIGQNGQPAAAIKNLPGMLSSDEITMQQVTLLSNGEQDLIIGNQDQWLTFYNIIKVQPDQFTMLKGGLELAAGLDLEIPLLNKSYGSFRYTQQNGQLQSQFLGMDVGFTMPGNTLFVGDQILGSQTLKQNRFEAIGHIKHKNKIKLFTRLVKDPDSTYVYVDPLHQTLPISENGSSWMAEITGQSKAIPGTWNKFMFSGDFMGMKGVEDSKRRKTFTINGSINAENEGLDVKNISSSFAGMQITYDIENNRLTGSLDFDQDFASVQVKGHADYLADSDGWLFIAGGSFTTPGFGKLSAGLGIGDYGNMNTLIAGNSIEYLLLQEARNKQLPDIFQNGFSGFFFTGLKDIPQLSLPKTGFDFLFVSGSLEIVTGFDARLWMGFDDGASEFGIGVMAFSELTLMLDVAITCTSLYGYLGAELLVQGMYNTGSGAFSLAGCASITIAGALEQCTPVPFTPICELCVSECGSLGVRAFMEFDSTGNVDAGFSLGSCSGNNPLSQEIKDKFNCN